MFTTRLGRFAGIAVLLLAGCQSAEDRQAAELREFLRNRLPEIEALNTKVIAEYEAYLQETEASGPPAMVALVRRQLEKAQAGLPAELDSLRQKIEDYPALELQGLSREVELVLQHREERVEHVEEKRRRAQRWEEIHEDAKRFGRERRERTERAAREGPAWLKTTPPKKGD